MTTSTSTRPPLTAVVLRLSSSIARRCRHHRDGRDRPRHDCGRRRSAVRTPGRVASRPRRHRDHRGRGRPRHPRARLLPESCRAAFDRVPACAARHARRSACRRSRHGWPSSACRSISQALLDEAAAQRRPLDRSAAGRARDGQRAGHVADTREAFDRWLGSDGPAFVPRPGSSPEVVIGIIHRAGGLASLAHPGRTRIDSRIKALSRRRSRCDRGLSLRSRQGDGRSAITGWRLNSGCS